MSKVIKSVKFMLATGETFEIESKYICEMVIDEVHVRYARTGINKLEEIIHADKIYFLVFKEANKHYLSRSQRLFDRINNQRDISIITLCFEDESNVEVHTQWDCGEDDYTNSYQTVQISKNGDMYLAIGSQCELESYFSLYISDSSFIDTQRNLVSRRIRNE